MKGKTTTGHSVSLPFALGGGATPQASRTPSRPSAAPWTRIKVTIPCCE